MGVTDGLTDFRRLAEKGQVLKEPGVTTQRRREVEVGSLLLGNGKNNAIANKLLSYF